MRFKTIKAGAFGCLKEWESPELDGNLVVVYGRNESGKSTLFMLASTILYGWNPVSNNPYIPWNGTMPCCEAHIVCRDEQELKVLRRLRSRAEGSILSGDTCINLGNRAIDQLEFMPAQIYNEVYALTVDQLRFPEENVWKKLQDQLLGGQYLSYMQPVSTVVQKISSEANSLWRPDRQGKPKDRQLREELSDIYSRLKDAEENEKAMYAIHGELENLDIEMKKLIDDKTGITSYLDRFERLYPVYKKWITIKELTQKAGNIDFYEFIPDEPQKRIKELDEQLTCIKNELEVILSKKEESENILKSFTDFDRAVLNFSQEIRNITRSYNQIENDIRTSRELETQGVSYMDRVCDRAGAFLEGGWRAGISQILNGIDEARLRAAIESFRKIDSKFHQYEARVAGLRVRAGGRKLPKAMPVISAILTLAGAAGMFLLPHNISRTVPTILLTSGICLFIMLMFFRDRDTSMELKSAERELNKISEIRNDAIQSVRLSLKGLPIAQQRLEIPEESILMDVNILKDLVYNYEMSIHKKEIIDSRLENMDNTINRLLRTIGIMPGKEILKNITTLEICLSKAEMRKRDYEEVCKHIEEFKNNISGMRSGLETIESERQIILNGLNSLDGDSIENKIDNLMERRRCMQRAVTFKEELESSYPDIEDLLKEIQALKNDSWIFDVEKNAKAKVKRELLDQQLNGINEKIGSLKKELEHRQEKERLDDINGQIENIKDERRRIAVERDRLILLKNILIDAERRFREENQPDVLQRAGNYLSLITGGRYDRIFIREDEDTSLMVKSSYMDYPLEVGTPLSRGTQEQIYLALRLAMIDHLDGQGESLPLFLDEAMVNWDNTRLENGLKLLESICEKRQVFMFTCHKWLADSIQRNNHAQIIEL